MKLGVGGGWMVEPFVEIGSLWCSKVQPLSYLFDREGARMVVRSFMEPPKPPGSEETDQLSSRELELLELLARGFSNKEIASTLSISTGTVRTHLMHIYEKLHVRCRTEAAAKYLRSRSDVPNFPPARD